MPDRIFTAFAIEDANLRTLLVGQARHENSPFEFIDMSVKEPWDNDWKTKCRTRIRSCKGVIGIITNNTARAAGQLWEIGCAFEEKKPVFLMYGNNDRPVNLPQPIAGRQINLWTWQNIAAFLRRL
jgi:nucleoside 2-deoxyribosyltransferase